MTGMAEEWAQKSSFIGMEAQNLDLRMFHDNINI